MMDLDRLKRAIAIDSDVFDDVLTLCLNAAESKVQNSIGTKYPDFYADNYLYDLAVIQLADHYFKNRSATTQKGEVPILYGVNEIILQLKPKYRIYAQKQEMSDENDS
ncbi:head-tail connector protein [Ligilactobacillus salivarius]|uniref:head-tail connector protein n=2 Tax=Ligilactobacillus salivarius TaxID=1624 RepID=UPI003CFE83DE